MDKTLEGDDVLRLLGNLHAWKEIQQWEREWWLHTDQLPEEFKKQAFYAAQMGLPPNFDCQQHSILDVGCGPMSMLLRCTGYTEAIALDPIDYGPFEDLYKDVPHLLRLILPAELYTVEHQSDEVWMYNVLQHVVNPQRVLDVIRTAAAFTVRIFEWVDIPPYRGHLHMTTAPQLVEAFPEKEWQRELKTGKAPWDGTRFAALIAHRLGTTGDQS